MCRRGRKESDESLCTVWSLVMVREPAASVKGEQNCHRDTFAKFSSRRRSRCLSLFQIYTNDGEKNFFVPFDDFPRRFDQLLPSNNYSRPRAGLEILLVGFDKFSGVESWHKSISLVVPFDWLVNCV